MILKLKRGEVEEYPGIHVFAVDDEAKQMFKDMDIKNEYWGMTCRTLEKTIRELGYEIFSYAAAARIQHLDITIDYTDIEKEEKQS